MTTLAHINLIDVKKTYYGLIDKSNSLNVEYDNIMKRLRYLNIPSASSFLSILLPDKSYKDIKVEIDNLKRNIEEVEKNVNKWIVEATELYFDTTFPPKLDQPEMGVNYINQQSYLLSHIDLLIRNIQTLYSSINILISEFQISKDSAVNTRRFYAGIILAVIFSFVGMIT
ncbi:MAG: hypothetical protein L0Y68_07830 [Candidatus Dadabacteria bacterium]|nr:hypothetical protein [Candidatus Dadabacteria bacterium]